MKKFIVLSLRNTLVSLFIIVLLGSAIVFNLHGSYNVMQKGVPRGVFLGEIPMEKKLRSEVTLIVQKESLLSLKRPRNAFFDPQTGHLVKETYGEKIDVPATVEMIMQGKPYNVYEPVKICLEPEFTMDIFKGITERKGSFSTWFGNGGRAENIRLAAAYINNYLLGPGEIFSFNNVTGHNQPGRGYQLAPIIVGNSVIPGYGGGVCQVSTTLYNAVLNSGLEIVERFPHSRPVGYVPAGRDATVSNHLDFKFRNNTNNYILIKGGGEGYCVYFEIWSSPD